MARSVRYAPVVASRILGEDVTTWINQRRAAGQAWRTIAKELKAATDGAVDVVHETIRNWASIGDPPTAR